MRSAKDRDELLLPDTERQQAQGKQVAFRANVALPNRKSTKRLDSAIVSSAPGQ